MLELILHSSQGGACLCNATLVGDSVPEIRPRHIKYPATVSPSVPPCGLAGFRRRLAVWRRVVVPDAAHARWRQPIWRHIVQTMAPIVFGKHSAIARRTWPACPDNHPAPLTRVVTRLATAHGWRLAIRRQITEPHFASTAGGHAIRRNLIGLPATVTPIIVTLIAMITSVSIPITVPIPAIVVSRTIDNTLTRLIAHTLFPMAWNKTPAPTITLPVIGNPHRLRLGLDPYASYPDVTPPIPTPVARTPFVTMTPRWHSLIARGWRFPFNIHLHGWWRWYAHINPGQRWQWQVNIQTVTRLHMRHRQHANSTHAQHPHQFS